MKVSYFRAELRHIVPVLILLLVGIGAVRPVFITTPLRFFDAAASTWFVTPDVSRSEVLAPLDGTTIQVIVVMLLSSALVGLLRRRHLVRAREEKQQAEMERQELRGRYDLLTRFANEAILVWESDGRILEVNDRALEMFDYSREELLGMTVFQLKPEELIGDIQKFSLLVEERKSAVFETTNLRKGGLRFPTEVTASHITVENRRVNLSIVRDISERKQAEQQIKHLNHLYAVLSRCNAAIVRARSEEDLFGEVCRIVAESGGFQVGWIGKVDPETKQVVPVAKAGEGAAYLDEVRIMADGPMGGGPTGVCIREGRSIACSDFLNEPVVAQWRESAMRYQLRSSICLPLARRGKTVYVLGMYSSELSFFNAEEIALAEEVGESLSFALDRMDLEQERERAEQERQIAQERLELALDAANEGYWDWKTGTDEWYMSPRFCAMFGYQPGEMETGLEAQRGMVHPEDRPRLKTWGENLSRGGSGTQTLEYRRRHKDGRYLWVSTSAKVVSRDDQGHPTRVVGTSVDITQRKLLEQQFLQAQRMESVGRLAGGVAHDFNNHLQVINGYAALMRKRLPAGSAMAESLGEICDAGQRAAALTRQLLAFSRKDVEQRKLINPNTVITGLQNMLYRLMGENVELQFDLAPDVGQVLADTTHLEQIVMNLTINARDAIRDLGHVIVKTESTVLRGEAPRPDRSGPYVRLTVTDDGSGMTPEVQQHIFEPFYTTKDKSRGTGLGLATAYGIVVGCGGFIEVESEPGTGSSFRIYLPSVGDTPAEMTAEEAPKHVTGGRETVLVVEDQSNVCQLTAGILEHYGYRVLVAASGNDALHLCGQHKGKIDLVVSDIMMPGMRGTELVQRLLQSRPGIKVLYVSGYAGESIRQEELTRDGALFLPKPFTPEVLVAKVRELLSGDSSVTSAV